MDNMMIMKNSVALCAASVVLCVTKKTNYTEVHGEDTEGHREKSAQQKIKG